MFRGLRKILGICTLEDYLSKDKNGETLLENILKEGKELNYEQELKLRKSIEAGYIYAKYGKSLFGFKYTEEQLFTKIDNEFFIEYLLSKKECSCWMVEVITEHIEFIDLLIKYDKYSLIWINKELVNKLLVKDDNNNYLIEKYIKDENVIKYLIIKCDDGKILLELFEKENINLLNYCNAQALMSKINDNETLLEYLLSKKIIPNNLLSIPNNEEYIRFLIDKELLEYFKYAKEDVLLNTINNKTVLELLIQKNIIDKINFNISSKETIYILNRLNRLDLITTVYLNLLVKPSKDILGKQGNKNTLLEYLLDKGYKPLIYTTYSTTNKEKELIFTILYNRKEYELIAKSIDKKDLFYTFVNKKLLIDILLENNINILLVDKIDLKILLNKYKDKTYLDFVLEMIKNKNIKYNLTNIYLSNSDINEIVKFYIILAKHDMMNYIKPLKEEELLKKYDGKVLLEELLKADRDLTINKILSEDVKSELNIAVLLRNKGIIVEDVDILIKDVDVTTDYLRKQQMRYGIGPLYEKGDYLLTKLETLFLTDGKSDKDLIMSLVCGYRQALITNYNVYIKELELLIKIKENNPHFYYLKTSKGSYFKIGIGCVCCDKFNVRTIIHETGHALHWYTNRSKYPSNLEGVLNNVRNNKHILKKIEKFTKQYYKVKDMLNLLAEEKYNDYLNNYEKNYDVEEIIKRIKDKKKKEYSNLEIDEEKLDSILDEIITKEEYIKTQKRYFIDEQISVMIFEEYGTMISILDIIDGIFEGDFYSENLVNEKDELIKGTVGHGIPYYSCDLESIFCEMIAQFSVICKCYNADVMLELLRDTVGDELYNLISDYYYNNILDVMRNTKKTKTLNKK